MGKKRKEAVRLDCGVEGTEEAVELDNGGWGWGAEITKTEQWSDM